MPSGSVQKNFHKITKRSIENEKEHNKGFMLQKSP